jgi:hypothetical protein
MTTVTLSFANNFWGKEDAGVDPLLQRMHNAKQTCDELRVFYNGQFLPSNLNHSIDSLQHAPPSKTIMRGNYCHYHESR